MDPRLGHDLSVSGGKAFPGFGLPVPVQRLGALRRLEERRRRAAEDRPKARPASLREPAGRPRDRARGGRGRCQRCRHDPHDRGVPSRSEGSGAKSWNDAPAIRAGLSGLPRRRQRPVVEPRHRRRRHARPRGRHRAIRQSPHGRTLPRGEFGRRELRGARREPRAAGRNARRGRLQDRGRVSTDALPALLRRTEAPGFLRKSLYRQRRRARPDLQRPEGPRGAGSAVGTFHRPAGRGNPRGGSGLGARNHPLLDAAAAGDHIFMNRPIEDLPTPAVLVDLDVLERNIARQAERAHAAGVRLRPHAKTHKCPEIAGMQLAAGAAGISLAKTSEAEVFAAAGFDDIFIAYPVAGLGKAERLLALSERLRLAAGTDSVEGARHLSETFRAAGRRLDVLLKVDVGYHRVGVLLEFAEAVGRKIAELPGLSLRGVFTHAGHVYAAETPGAVAEIGKLEGETLVSTASTLRSAGYSIDEVSVGSTPSAGHAMRVAGVTECRPGNYVVHDGSKTLSQDSLRPRPNGHGLILGTQSRLQSLSEEHGVARVEEGDSFLVGQRVRILPNHACVVSNLHDRLYGVRAGRVETEFRIAARGRVE